MKTFNTLNPWILLVVFLVHLIPIYSTSTDVPKISITSACHACVPQQYKRCCFLLKLTTSETIGLRNIFRSRRLYHVLFTGASGKEKLNCIYKVMPTLQFPDEIIKGTTSTERPFPRHSFTPQPIQTRKLSVSGRVFPDSPWFIPRITFPGRTLGPFVTSNPVVSSPSTLIPFASLSPTPSPLQSILPDDFSVEVSPSINLEILQREFFDVLAGLVPIETRESLRLEANLVRTDVPGFPTAQFPAFTGGPNDQPAPSPAVGAASYYSFHQAVEIEEDVFTRVAIDDCRRANCAAQVNVFSQKTLRLSIIRRAIRQLQRRVTFADVFDTSSSNSQVVRRGPRWYSVFFTFKDSYLAEF